MLCFYHHDKQAVGLCRYCGKGICSECSVDLGGGLACRNRCEDKVRGVTLMVDQTIKASENPTKMQLVDPGRLPPKAPTPIFEAITVRVDQHIQQTYRFKLTVAAGYATVGVLLFAGGITREMLFLTIAGLVCASLGIYTIIQARKLASPSKPPKTKP